MPKPLALRLREEAEPAAAARGHQMIAWVTVQPAEGSRRADRQVQQSTCRRCLATLTIDSHPPDKQSRIQGSALAVNCQPVKADKQKAQEPIERFRIRCAGRGASSYPPRPAGLYPCQYDRRAWTHQEMIEALEEHARKCEHAALLITTEEIRP